VSDLADIRESYTKGTLDSHDLIDNPLDLFTKWLQQVIDSDMTDPTAMTIATVNNAGQPCQRIVLLKDVNADGFVFFTNLASRKPKS
jgi:pyridoxamine 5'-phosphate oxidase